MAPVRRYGISIRKLADYSRGRRVGADGKAMEAWPLLGVTFVGGEPAEHLRLPEKTVLEGYRAGYIELVGAEPILRPAGPPHAPLAGKTGAAGQNHNFIHAKQVVFHMVEGDYVYDVRTNPDKQHVNRIKTGGDVEGGEVWHHYDLDLAEKKLNGSVPA